MNKLCAVLILLLVPTAHAENLFKNDFYQQIDPELHEIINAAHEENYPKALDIIESLIERYPTHLIGYFFKAAVCDSIIRDYYDYRFKPIFFEAANKAIELGWKHVEDAEKRGIRPDPWIIFYLGGSHGYRGTQYFYDGQFFSALKDGLTAVKALKRCLNENPKIYDVYFGLGTFYYWKSAKAKYLTFLPFISDEREKGIKYLQLTTEKGFYTVLEAQYALTRIYFNEKRFDDGFRINNLIADLYPRDIFCLIQKGEALMELKRWQEASENYRLLLTLLSESQLHCFERIAEIALLRTHALEALNDSSEIEFTYQILLNEKERREKYEFISERSLAFVSELTKIRNSITTH
ncbi:hypothetical protein KDK77_05645 [bacterium]|nr:hypothetical protein [bacterium]